MAEQPGVHLKLGQRVLAKVGDRTVSGVVRFVGKVHFEDGVWEGIELQQAVKKEVGGGSDGRTSGVLDGVFYFGCLDGCALWRRCDGQPPSPPKQQQQQPPKPTTPLRPVKQSRSSPVHTPPVTRQIFPMSRTPTPPPRSSVGTLRALGPARSHSEVTQINRRPSAVRS
eukprot:TRINITY_DN34252_c0_g1_i1.p1 TRINITY_DN34252_c0_g1~~TRINITY_DN34252_c0_g1_i1.p1  ORF type:complete len:183 (+),score=27.66 TRINITY_DN34252_c0_g1_i1:43-549(+)